MTKEINNLKRQARQIRKMIMALDILIESIELPIRLKMEVIEDHKNLNSVWKEIGLINLNDYAPKESV